MDWERGQEVNLEWDREERRQVYRAGDWGLVYRRMRRCWTEVYHMVAVATQTSD